MKLTRAESLDSDRIIQFYRDVIANTPGIDTYARWVYGQHPTDAMILGYIQAGAMYYWEQDGQILCAAAISCQSADYHETAWAVSLPDDAVSVVHILCVSPAVQKQGIAHKMMHMITDMSRDRGAKAIRLDALACNTPAHRLYQSLGFQKMDTKHWYADNTGWTDFYLFELVL